MRGCICVRASGVDAPLAELLADPTVAGVAALVARLRAAYPGWRGRSPVLVPIREDGTRPPLFLVHGMLGQAFVSPAFLKALGDDQPLYGFQARGADGRGAPHRGLRAMARDYVTAMREVQPRGPYLLGGICAGCIVAQELARPLAAEGVALAPLLLIDPPLPGAGRSWSRRVRKGLGILAARTPGVRRLRAKILENVRERLRERSRERRIPFDPGDAGMREAAVRAALDFKLALLRHRPAPYPGDAFVLASRRRLASDWRDGGPQRRLYAAVRLYEVAEQHDEVLDPANERFAAALSDGIRAAHAALGEGRT